jgi:hypothetical protein
MQIAEPPPQNNRSGYYVWLEKIGYYNQKSVNSVAAAFLYAAILITICLQLASDAES